MAVALRLNPNHNYDSRLVTLHGRKCFVEPVYTGEKEIAVKVGHVAIVHGHIRGIVIDAKGTFVAVVGIAMMSHSVAGLARIELLVTDFKGVRAG